MVKNHSHSFIKKRDFLYKYEFKTLSKAESIDYAFNANNANDKKFNNEEKNYEKPFENCAYDLIIRSHNQIACFDREKGCEENLYLSFKKNEKSEINKAANFDINSTRLEENLIKHERVLLT